MTDIAIRAEHDAAEITRLLGLNPRDPKTQAMVAVCQQYGLDPLLKHVVVIPQGGVYITRDGLLHVAHRSGQLDGIVLESGPELVDGEWRCVVSVYRKDMSRPFTFPGRYPANGGNRKYAPEMALKVAECMALRRAFDVSGLGVQEEAEVGMVAAAPVERPAERPRAAHDSRWDRQVEQQTYEDAVVVDESIGEMGRANPHIAAGRVDAEAVAAEVLVDVPDDAQGYQSPPFVSPGGAPTQKQMGLMWGLLKKAYGDDVELQRAAISDALGRDVESTKTLTSREVSKVIDAVKAAAS